MAPRTLAELQETGLPTGETIAGRLGYVHDLFLDFDYEMVDRLPPEAGDLVVIADNRDPLGKLERVAAHRGRVVFVPAPSDASFPPAGRGEPTLPKNLVAAFVVNNECRDGRIVSLPLGIRIENVEHWRRTERRSDNRRDGLLYGNFNVKPLVYGSPEAPQPHIRHRLVSRLATAPWASLDVAEGARTTAAEQHAYYAEMSRHRFVLSPEGIGTDCYRHWEALYLGTVPIVRAGTAMDAFAELPILFTEDYTEIDERYLEEQWRRFTGARFRLQKLTRSFYRRRFLESIDVLSNPRFVCWGFRGTPDEGFLKRVAKANPASSER